METKLIKKTFVKEYKNTYFFFNAFTNATLEVEKGNWTSPEEYVEKNYDELIDSGVLCYTEEAYYELMKFFYNRDTTNTLSLTVTDAASYDCNLRCVYCMQQNTPNKVKSIEPEERAEVYRSLMEILNAESLSICFFGGEPFLKDDYIDNMISAVNRLQIPVKSLFAVTNGTMINDRIIESINKYRIESLQITLDGIKEIHDSRRVGKDKSGSFEIIINNIRRVLEETESDIYINTVIDARTYGSYLEMVDFIVSNFGEYMFDDESRIVFNLGNECDPYQGCKYTEENKMIDIDGIHKFYALLKELIMKGVPVNTLLPAASCLRDNYREIIMAPDGSIYNCITGLGIDEFKVCSREEILERPLLTLTKIASSHKSIKSDSRCLKCEYYGMCNGGCYYDMISRNEKTACQKLLLNESVDLLMDIVRMVDEIRPDVYRIKDMG